MTLKLIKLIIFYSIDEKTKDTKITASSETILHGLKKFTNYSMEVLATTNGGDGVRSAPIHCQTEQDGEFIGQSSPNEPHFILLFSNLQ